VPVLHLWNKADLVQEGAPREGLLLSAREGTGLQALRQQLLQTIGWQGGGAGEGVFMARERHVQALQRAQSHLQRAHALLQSLATAPLDLLAEELRLAHQALAQIVGEFTADDLLGVIFSRFCIGK
jgi:tRNA modification GTPase